MSRETLSVHILDKDYQVACPSEERDSLLKAATELDNRMRTIRQSGNVIGVERIAVMAALNLAHEVLHLSQRNEPLDQELVNDMCNRVEKILSL
ncbi:cell division protein ZapA [Candidatus Endobugula sertula]|uniref:Cell division protein ZapA n=1 Tax=Candidatus Endobugula sertula TaxID=62101 RepID=A0A1D2QR67_9GAMM|nr:cell division protein ZapA [Candidatus Endobugula sertula]